MLCLDVQQSRNDIMCPLFRTRQVLKCSITWSPRSPSRLAYSTAPATTAAAALHHFSCVHAVTEVSTIRLALFLSLIKVRLLFDGGTAVFGDLLVRLSATIQVGCADFRTSAFDELLYGKRLIKKMKKTKGSTYQSRLDQRRHRRRW